MRTPTADPTFTSQACSWRPGSDETIGLVVFDNVDGTHLDLLGG